ncbi:xanthine dehydrogenase family protein molybdopterin-binding subunit [Rhizobium lusitanum]|uniref:xanthine dehydrogenase family protein molybdopterin-binding subunit n=1 Tax=Rhizobium lusitanum TaxID=293958 RepID=UPI001574BE53|nr:xanthine dehydrogenase family protein molybdopterin-binding subunit [Rhizobium lusitanum]NTJ11796.1 xanthine dehydrogenase family protein [Rhizobium lusitanum]
MSTSLFGASILRREDPKLVRGQGCYLDDMVLPEMLHVVIKRSEYARARLKKIDLSGALETPGVVAAFSAADLGSAADAFPLLLPHKGLDAAVWGALARDEARFAGEAVACVLAGTVYAAMDGVEAIDIDYEELPPVVDLERAVLDDSPRVHSDIPNNISMRFFQSTGDARAALETAPHRLVRRLHVCRGAGMPMEPRAVMAQMNPVSGELIVWSNTQEPHTVRDTISKVLNLSPKKVRVVCPDTGGGFGTKLNVYPEEVLVPWLALTLGRAVKWIETRSEHMLSAQHERDQLHDIEIGFDDDGRFLALKDRFLHDNGAYCPRGGAVPCNTSSALPGPYRIPNIEFEVVSVYTNKVNVSAYRGAGQQQSSFIMERMVDMVASHLGKDPAEIRRLNTIPDEMFPFNTGLTNLLGGPVEYDSGVFSGTLEQAIEGSEYEKLRALQAQARAEGRYVGIGIGSYVELTGRGPWEGAGVRVEPDGRATVYTGASSQGQSHQTTFAQIAAEFLGIPYDMITVVSGDTALIPFGIGTFASRVGVLTGNAVRESSIEVRKRILKVGARILELPEDAVELVDGEVRSRETSNRTATLKEIAHAAIVQLTPDPEESTLDVVRYFKGPNITYTNGTHVAMVEVDIDTGVTKILKYVVSHDCGRMINPIVVEGQMHGGVACGIGNALLEFHSYDDNGQLLTGSFMDYAMPRASDMPDLTLLHQECPAVTNPLGMRGTGEAGAISVPATIANAVEDALKPLGVRIETAPLTPYRLWRIINEQRKVARMIPELA